MMKLESGVHGEAAAEAFLKLQFSQLACGRQSSRCGHHYSMNSKKIWWWCGYHGEFATSWSHDRAWLMFA